MTEPGSRQGRARDAQRAREVILDAAEAVFAQHGFDGARIDAIAKASGYNTSLLFQYFGDKLGLYTAVLKRADRDLDALLARVLAPLLEDETIASYARGFRTFLETLVQATFDYLVEHPRFMRMLLWEMAEGWQTYAKIVPQLNTEDTLRLKTLFHTARNAGLLRSGFPPLIEMTLALPICQSYLAFLPLYQQLLPGEDISSAPALARAREHIVAFIVAGMLIDSPAGEA